MFLLGSFFISYVVRYLTEFRLDYCSKNLKKTQKKTMVRSFSSKGFVRANCLKKDSMSDVC